jgi:putative transposase
MPRTARLVVEYVPYHITQRGNRRQDVFLNDDDRRQYLGWLRDYSERHGLELLAYCIMDNHVHLVAVPHSLDSIARVLQTLHMRHSQSINSREGWGGHLWQGRFSSTGLDEAHLWAAVRYVELNPVRAEIVQRAEEYAWSSAAFHLGIRPDRYINTSSEWGSAVEGWAEALSLPEDEQVVDLIRLRTKTGFPCGDEDFLARMAKISGRDMVVRQVGRPKRTNK